MAGLNEVKIIGYLGRDPEIKDGKDGKRVANLSIGVSDSWKDKDGNKQEKTEWIPVVIFNDALAKIAEKYLRKGSLVLIEGAFKTRKWTDKDGTERYKTEVVLSAYSGTLIMLGSPNGGRGGASDYNAPPVNNPRPSDDMPFGDDDIPF